MSRKPKVFTWHIHGSYLHYLSHANADFYIPYSVDEKPGYVGVRGSNFDWRSNLHEIPVENVQDTDFDIILFQNKQQYLTDQYSLFSQKQLELPKVFVEHDPPRIHPVDTDHWVDDPNILVVHVTYFNQLMWDNHRSPTAVVEHGVTDSGYNYTGKIPKGIVMVNGLGSTKRGLRRMGYDVFEQVRQHIPLDVIGMESKEIGGLGEVAHKDLSEFLGQYRFFFNPIRYTSLGLSVLEAMMSGLPIVGLATTEMSRAIEHNESGFLTNSIDELTGYMQWLLENPENAKYMGQQARRQAKNHYTIARFAKDWEKVFANVLSKSKRKESISNPESRSRVKTSVAFRDLSL